MFFPDAPSAPTNVIRTKSNNSSITISWGAPSDIGNKPITKYSLAMDSPTSVSKSETYSVIGNATKYEYTFVKLKENSSYTVYVSAYNLFGKGNEAKLIFETVSYPRPGR